MSGFCILNQFRKPFIGVCVNTFSSHYLFVVVVEVRTCFHEKYKNVPIYNKYMCSIYLGKYLITGKPCTLVD